MTEPEDLVRSTTRAIASTVLDVPPLRLTPAQDDVLPSPRFRAGCAAGPAGSPRSLPPRSCWRSPRRWWPSGISRTVAWFLP